VLLQVNKDGNFLDNTFKIVDNTDITKTLKFDLSTSTTGADITLDYRSVTDRSLIWNLTGATGTAALTFVWAGTTVARTITFPSSASFTVAGLSIASQVFTRAFTITPTTGTAALTITSDDAGGTGTTGLVITDASVGGDVLSFTTNVGLTIVGSYSFLTAIGGSLGSIGVSETLTAGRIWGFPNFGGHVLIGGTTAQGTAQTASVATQNLVTAAGALTTWLINAYLVVTTAEAGTGTVSMTIGWTDVGGARTSQIAARTLTTLGSTQGTLMIQVQSSSNITYFTTYTPTAGGVTEAYAYYIQATKL
jgi:hypothetical protein